MNYYLIAASHRPDSLNRKLVLEVRNYLRKIGHTADIDEYSALDLPTYNDFSYSDATQPEALKTLVQKLSQASGLIISTPEYNWSYPGSLKTIIDWLSRIKPNPLAGKVALLLSASPSARGGILGLTHLKTSLEALDMFVHPRMFTLGNAIQAFAPDGSLSNPEKQQQLNALLAAYVQTSHALGDSSPPPLPS